MDKRVIKTRQAIQDAYFYLLFEKKSTRITVTELARVANIDRKTFYLHYNEVEDVMAAFAKGIMNRFVEDLKNSGYYGNVLEIEKVFGVLNHMLEEDIDFYRKLAACPATEILWNELQQALEQSVVKELMTTQKGMVSSVLRLSRVQIYSEYLTAGIVKTYREWLRNDQGISLDELAEIETEITRHGMNAVFQFVI